MLLRLELSYKGKNIIIGMYLNQINSCGVLNAQKPEALKVWLSKRNSYFKTIVSKIKLNTP